MGSWDENRVNKTQNNPKTDGTKMLIHTASVRVTTVLYRQQEPNSREKP